MWFSVATSVWMLLVHKGEGALMGPWMGIVDKVVECQDDIYKDLPPFLLMTIEKNGKQARTVTAGSITAPAGINDDSELTMRILEFKNGRSDVVAMKNFGGACTALNTWVQNIWRLIAAQCPLEIYPEGSLKCSKPGKGDMTVPFDLPPITVDGIPTFMYGKYRVDMIMQHNNQTLYGCSSFFATVVSKSIKG